MDQLAVSFDCDPPISPRTTVSVQGVHTRHASLVSASLTSTSRHTHHAGADMAPSPSASPLLGTPPLLLPRRRAALYPNILEGGHARQMSRSTPAVAHRVQVVVCASCDGFLTDRGMRAVLLLRPDVVLYSTDQEPANIGFLAPPTLGKAGEDRKTTCVCTTSPMACRGCGSTVGYHILAPCPPCTSSIARIQSTTHHRYVFHSERVRATDRNELPVDEQVILPTRPPLSPHAAFLSFSWSNTSSHSLVPTISVEDGSSDETRARSVRGPTTSSRSNARAASRRGSKSAIYWHELEVGGLPAVLVDPRGRGGFHGNAGR